MLHRVPSARERRGFHADAGGARADGPGFHRRQIVKRYLLGASCHPRASATGERVCRGNPVLVEEIGLAEQVQQAVKLIEASGQPGDSGERPKQLWEKPPFIAAAGSGAPGGGDCCHRHSASQLSDARSRVAQLQRDVIQAPDRSASGAHSAVIPSRTGAAEPDVRDRGQRRRARRNEDRPVMVRRTRVRIQIERDQGIVAVLHNVQKDSNGHLRVAPSAFGPGAYDVAIDALDWRGQARPAAWTSFEVTRGALSPLAPPLRSLFAMILPMWSPSRISV